MISSIFALIMYGFIFALIEMLISDAMPIYIGAFLKNVIIGMVYFLLIKWILLYL